MITLDDCNAFCDVAPATVARLARREQLPEIVAIACAQSRLMTVRSIGGSTPIRLVHAAFETRRLAA